MASLYHPPSRSATEQRWLESVCDGRTRAVPTNLAHELVERRAAADPDTVALRFRDRTLTYAELNRRANQLARYLIDHGIGARCPVVVCVEPSFDIVVALLAILKAGAVYVPLDPSYPPARMRAIVDDTKPKLVITQLHLQAKLELGSIPALAIDTDPAPHDHFGVENPGTVIDPARPAYIYYTSGTTGQPKGVVGTHANLLHYVQSVEQRYQMCRHDVMPAIARFGFSISMFELLSPLVAGGTLILLEREHILDPARMSATLAEVTFFHAGPSLLKGLIAYIRGHGRDVAAFARVRHASSGGDMVPPEVLEALKEIFTNAEVFVIYGCSEISCMGTTYPVPRDHAITTTYVGRPFDNVSVRVLDADNTVLAPGVVGEIHFAGTGITEGYLERPELTAEKFVMLGDQRFYRTGDRGRLSHDGWLEILGRNDFQTKIRGMRVELAEVEHVLRRAPGVRDAVATARDSADHEKVLIAYVVTDRPNVPGDPRDDKRERIAAIRRHMIDQVPDYMVPAIYVELDALPLNHNMKIDRRALPAPDEDDLRATSETSVRRPETPTERTLMSLWQTLLGVQTIGLDDNFFELGGHSMLALELSLEVEKRLGIPLEGMDILREPLDVLAAICDRRLGAERAPTPPRRRVSVGVNPVEIFHFGRDNGLYGVIHGGRSEATAAVLICPPVGQEHVRARFVLTRLAKHLAREGMPTMTFDYFGCGDSLGDSVDAGPLRWQADIAEAHAELQRRTNGARVTAVGVRLGALLLCQIASGLDLAKWVLWDPVSDGSLHGRELAEMQRRCLRSIAHLRLLKWGRARPRGNELLGTTYSDAALRELAALTLAPRLAESKVTVRLLRTVPPVHDATSLRPIDIGADGRRERVDVDCGWRDVSRLEEVIPDLRLSTILATMVTEAR